MKKATSSTRKTIVFVHGMFVTGESWADWVTWFEKRGYRCLAPSWPGREGEPAKLRASPPEALSSLSLSDVVATYRSVIAGLDEPPILVGHSMGGLVVQLLLAEGLGAVGVAMNSAPPRGVTCFEWSFLRSNAAALVPGSRPIVPTLKWFEYAFAHTLSDAKLADAFESFIVPESRLVARGPASSEGAIDFEAPRAPLLMVAGALDRTIPPRLNRDNARRYGAAAPTDFRYFEGRIHWICRQRGWREVAAIIEEWLSDRARLG